MTEDVIEEKYRKLLMIWGLMLSSQIAFLLVIIIALPNLFTFDSNLPFFGQNFLLILIFGVISFFNLFLAFFLRSKFVKEAAKKQDPEQVQNGVIVGTVLCETLSLFGFMLAIAAEYPYFYVWFIVGIIATLLQIPRKSELADAMPKKKIAS